MKCIFSVQLHTLVALFLSWFLQIEFLQRLELMCAHKNLAFIPFPYIIHDWLGMDGYWETRDLTDSAMETIL